MARAVLALVALLQLSSWTAASAQSPVGPLVSEETARLSGLHRDWYTQIDMDSTRYKVTHVTYHRGAVFLMTSSGMLHALDAETGAVLWSAEIGRENQPNVAAGVGNKFVVTVNGSRLSVLNRADGRVLWNRQTLGVPSARPAVGDKLALLPTLDGLVEAYDLFEPKRPPSRFTAGGKTIFDPLMTTTSVAIPTTSGSVYVCYPDTAQSLFRLRAGGAISNTPGYCPPLMLVGSLDGYVYAVHQTRGAVAWEFSTGEPVRYTPVGFNKTVVVGGKIEAGDKFQLTLRGEVVNNKRLPDKTLSVAATTTSATIAAADLAHAWNTTKEKEFADVTAVVGQGYDGTITKAEFETLTITPLTGKPQSYPLDESVVISWHGRRLSGHELPVGGKVLLQFDKQGKLVGVTNVPDSPAAVITLSNEVGAVPYTVVVTTTEGDGKAGDGQSLALYDDGVYVLPELGGMHALSAETGQQRWWTPGVTAVVAASPARLYVKDKGNQLVILDRASGAALAGFSLPDKLLPFINTYTDRVVLVSETGLVQSLHEAEFAQPVIFEPPAIVEPPKAKPKKTGADAAADAAEAADTEADAGEEGDAEAVEEEAEDVGEEEDPFAEGGDEAEAEGMEGMEEEAEEPAMEEDDPFADE